MSSTKNESLPLKGMASPTKGSFRKYLTQDRERWVHEKK